MAERIDIERGLDNLASDEAGFEFQSLAVSASAIRPGITAPPSPTRGRTFRLSANAENCNLNEKPLTH